MVLKNEMKYFIVAMLRTVLCEPLVTMGQLSRTLDPLGWTIPVLPGI
jgi:hypothetical protein